MCALGRVPRSQNLSMALVKPSSLSSPIKIGPTEETFALTSQPGNIQTGILEHVAPADFVGAADFLELVEKEIAAIQLHLAKLCWISKEETES